MYTITALTIVMIVASVIVASVVVAHGHVVDVHDKGLGDGERLGNARALDDEVVVGLVRLAELPDRPEEVAAERAADAAVVELDHLRLLLHEPVLLDLLRVNVDAPCFVI